jgi:hypothetical protein
MAVIMKMTVFWDFAPCSLVEMADISEVLTASVFRAMSALIVRVEKKKSFWITYNLFWNTVVSLVLLGIPFCGWLNFNKYLLNHFHKNHHFIFPSLC